MNITLALPNHPLIAIANWLQAKLVEYSESSQAVVGPNYKELCLASNEIRALANPQGVTVECLKGCIWITIDGDPRDVVLGTGQSLTLARDKRTLIMALEPTHIQCIDPVAG
jgi:hypothetical protein